MINKQELLDKLEEERAFAAECHLPQMALGLVQAIKVVESMEDDR